LGYSAYARSLGKPVRFTPSGDLPHQQRTAGHRSMTRIPKK